MTSARGPIWRPILLAAAWALGVALLGGLMTDLGPWYEGLSKPAWQPPGWLFGPVWTAIFALTALSGAAAWRRTRMARDRQLILILFLVNGTLNVLWSLLFFRLHRPDWALGEVLLLWLSVLILMIVLARFSRAAAWLLAPYLIWVAFAGFLNYTVVKLNAPFGA
jgi:tryptophan-rich sensory protein